MMGKDCERMLKSINTIKDALINAVASMMSSISSPIEMEKYHIEGDYINEDIEMREKENSASVTSSIETALNAMSEFEDDIGKMSELEENGYTSSNEFNNSYGSPWTEIHKLSEAMEKVGSMQSSLSYIGQRVGLICTMSYAAVAAIDAKYALTIYHDYIQRGFDAKYNEKTPSIVFKTAKKKDSMGNIDQDFEENVNVPRESIDPF